MLEGSLAGSKHMVPALAGCAIVYCPVWACDVREPPGLPRLQLMVVCVVIVVQSNLQPTSSGRTAATVPSALLSIRILDTLAFVNYNIIGCCHSNGIDARLSFVCFAVVPVSAARAVQCLNRPADSLPLALPLTPFIRKPISMFCLQIHCRAL